jgi:hypothetical protein
VQVEQSVPVILLHLEAESIWEAESISLTEPDELGVDRQAG